MILATSYVFAAVAAGFAVVFAHMIVDCVYDGVSSDLRFLVIGWMCEIDLAIVFYCHCFLSAFRDIAFRRGGIV
jgi:hypothetical protein